MASSTYCWAAVIAYSLLMVCVGYWTRLRATGDQEHLGLEFWIARRQLPGWRLGMSLTAGWLMLGWIGFGMGQTYLFGATGLWILPIPWLLLCFVILAMVPFVRRIPAVSLPQAIEQRFGAPARVLLAVFSIFVFTAWTQAETFMAGTLMSGFLGVEPWVCMVLLIAPIIFYTVMGGFRAVAMTDVIQFLIMAVFMIALAVAAVGAAGRASGGDILGALRKATPPSSGEGQVFNLWFNGLLFPVVLLIGYLPGWMTEQDLLLRIQAARTTREAMKGAVLAFGLIAVFVIALPTLAAFCALVAFPPVNGAPPEAVGADGTKIITAFLAPLPVALQVFALVGIVACQMSTVDTFANVTAMPLSHDLIEPVLRKRGAAERTRVAVARGVTVFVLLVALGCALISEKLGDVYYISSGVLSASIAVPAIFVFWKRTTSAAVIAAALAGFVTTVGLYWYEMKYLQAAEKLPELLQKSYGYLYVAAGVVVSAVLILVVSLLTPAPPPEQVAAVRERPVDDFGEFSSRAW